MHSLAAGILAALTVAAIAISSTLAGTSTSGLEGRVMRGPAQPVCVTFRMCQTTASAALAFWRGGREVARIKTGPTGAYRISLASGVYTVRPAFRHPQWRLWPSTVRVPVGHYARVNFFIDTGIE
jgi:hypothetical protein